MKQKTKEEKMETQIAKTETKAMAAPLDMGFANVDMRDVLLPKLLLMQGLSELVSDEKAKAGDIADSLTGEVLGGKDKPVEVIPFYMTRSFVVSEKMGDKFEFKGIVPCDSTNAHWRDKDHREEKVDGVLTRRDFSMDFFCLLASNTGEDALPYQVSFRRTSLKAGKQLYTQMLLSGGKPKKSWNLGSKKQENDLGTYYVFDVSKGKGLTPDQTEYCAMWISRIKSGAVKVAQEGDVPVENTNGGVEQF